MHIIFEYALFLQVSLTCAQTVKSNFRNENELLCISYLSSGIVVVAKDKSAMQITLIPN